MALLDLCPHTVASLLLDDFAEAFAVYENLNARTFHEDVQAVCAHYAPDAGNGVQQPFDTAVVACSWEATGEGREALITRIEKAVRSNARQTTADLRARKSHTQRPCSLYAIITVNDKDPQPGRALITNLEKAYARWGATWMGALLVADARPLTAVWRTARMGVWRRRTSEATDELIARVRMRQPAGVLEVTRPIPPLLRPFVHLHRTQKAPV